MKAVDKYVVYDDVNYIKGGWVNRNNILINGEKKLFTISLKGASPNKLFHEIEIGDNFKKLIRTLQMNYSKASHYMETISLLERIIAYPDKRLALFLTNSFREILSYLSIHTEIILSSSLDKDCSLKGKSKVLHICHILNADTYYNVIGGQNLYNKEEFMDEKIKLLFLDTQIKEYPQQSEKFIPSLSMIDILMNNSVEEINLLLDSYKLV